MEVTKSIMKIVEEMNRRKVSIELARDMTKLAYKYMCYVFDKQDIIEMQSEEHFNYAMTGTVAIAYNVLRNDEDKDHNTIFNILNEIAKFLTEVGVLSEPARRYLHGQMARDIREYRICLEWATV